MAKQIFIRKGVRKPTPAIKNEGEIIRRPDPKPDPKPSTS